MDCGFVGAAVESGLCVVDSIPRQHNLAPNEDRLAVTILEQIVAERNLPASRLVQRAGLIVDHADFERSRAPENILGPRCVLHARQLHDDPIAALLLNDGLCDAELVDTVAQNSDVLLDRAVLNALLRLRLESCDQPELATRRILFADEEIGKCRLDSDPRLVPFRLVLEAEHDVRLLAPDTAIDDAFLPHQRADVGRVPVGGLVERTLHVDLQQKIHAAAQVEAEIHRQGADRREPLWRR